MAAAFQLELMSPERVLFSQKIEELVLPGSEGELTIMADHAAMIICLIPGFIRIRNAGMAEQVFVVFDGFANITGEKCSLLVEAVWPAKDMTADDIENAITKSKKLLSHEKNGDLSRQEAEFLDQLKNFKRYIY